MSLRKKQSRFCRKLACLQRYADMIGVELTLGDGFRDVRVHGEFGVKKSYSHAKSLHKIRLAQDYNLFVDDDFIADGSHPMWKLLGEYWESLDEDARWGGRWGDANHFSFTHWGVK